MTAVTFPLRPPRLAFAICGRRWQNDVYEIKYSVSLLFQRSHCLSFLARKHTLHSEILYLLSPRNRCKHFRSIDFFI